MLKNTIIIAILCIGISCAAVDSLNVLMTMETINNNTLYNVAYGDINGDSLTDLAILKYVPFGDDTRLQVNICYGGDNFDLEPELSFFIGYYMNTIRMHGDINGDGADDLIIGQPYVSSGINFQESGRVLVYYGGTSMDSIPDLVLIGSDYSDLNYGIRFGYDIQFDEDINLDGYNDLFVFSEMEGFRSCGQVNIFLGSENPDNICDWSKTGEADSFYGLGSCFSDITGDSYPEIILYKEKTLVENSLVHYEYEYDIYRGGVTIPNEPETTITAPVEGQYLLDFIHAKRDINQDGRNDILITKNGADTLFCIYGNDSLNTNFTFFRHIDNGGLDLDHIFFYDLNSDNTDDLLFLRKRTYYDSQVDINYNLDWNGLPDITLSPDTTLDRFMIIGLPGDINNDGLNEIITYRFIQDNDGVHAEVEILNLISEQSEDSNIRPYREYQLSNYPNPFNPETKICFSIPEDSETELTIYNIKGQKVKTLVKEKLRGGKHEILWDGKDSGSNTVGSGVYLYKLNINGKTINTQKCILLK